MIIGRIYKLVSDETDDIYIGSTIQTLERRESGHTWDYKRYGEGKQHYMSSYKVVKYRDMRIELIFEGEFESVKEMHRLEGEYIRNTANSINRCIAGRSRQEVTKNIEKIINIRYKKRIKITERIIKIKLKNEWVLKLYVMSVELNIRMVVEPDTAGVRNTS